MAQGYPVTVTANMLHFILASSSLRRKALLADAGFGFEVLAPPIPEPEIASAKLAPAQQAEALAYFKARCVADSQPDAWVLGADTVVAAGRDVLGKPADRAEAERMLRRLSGTRHAVITGVALLGPGSGRRIASESTHVTMRPMSEQELDEYLTSGEWIGKAGSYAIQETADRFVTRVEGSFSNVVGLPVELVERLWAEARQEAGQEQA